MIMTTKSMQLVNFPFSDGQVQSPFMTVLCLPGNVYPQGDIVITYADAFAMRFAGLVDYNKDKHHVDSELGATKTLCDKISNQPYSLEAIELLLAEKYFKMAWIHKDYECIKAVSSFLMSLPTVRQKTAILNDLSHICEQIECHECCSYIDTHMTLLELNHHVFVDVA